MVFRTILTVFCVVLGNIDASERRKSSSVCHLDYSESFHDFTVKDIDGKEVAMSKFRGHVVLAVNVATFWGYTYQYIHLNALQDELAGKANSCGLRIVGFPCNQFGLQEPAKNKYELLNGLKYVRPGYGFEPKFPLFEKRDVNGKNESEIYTYFKVS